MVRNAAYFAMTSASFSTFDQSGGSLFSAVLTAFSAPVFPCSFCMIFLIAGGSSSLAAPAGWEIQPATANRTKTLAMHINDLIRCSLIRFGSIGINIPGHKTTKTS